jgi:hypothetical protein
MLKDLLLAAIGISVYKGREASSMDKPEPKETDWTWRYSLWTGIMYGPIPIGIIIAAILTVCFLIYEFTN